jgi:hypothetical protein
VTVFVIGLSIFEHSLVSLAAFAHNAKARRLFLGIVSDCAVYVAVLWNLAEMMMMIHPHTYFSPTLSDTMPSSSRMPASPTQRR